MNIFLCLGSVKDDEMLIFTYTKNDLVLCPRHCVKSIYAVMMHGFSFHVTSC